MQSAREAAAPLFRIVPVRLAAIVALGVLASACETIPLDSGAGERRAQEARTFEAQGAWIQAALNWDEAADRSPEPAASRYRLNAGLAYLKAGDIGRARDRINRSRAGLSGQDLDRASLAEAQLLLASGDAEGALAALESLDAQGAIAADWWKLRADALFAIGQDEAAVGAMVTRERFLGTPEALAASREELWQQLRQRAAAGASLEPTPAADSTVSGWMELARLQAAESPSSGKGRLLDWQRRYPDHPANATVLGGLLDTYRAALDFPQQVAVLLPLSGRLAGAGSAVRDGFMAGYLGADGDTPRPVLRVYDTAASSPESAYEQAVVEGADLVIGPLTKSDLEAVAAADLSRVTTLALNRLDDASLAPPGLYQLSLAPEDEAEEAARRALADGHFVGIVLRPDTGWGRRVGKAFAEAFEAGGGRVAATGVFDSRGQDYSDPIRRSLLLDESSSRHAALQKAIGMELEYEPRRRADATFAFVAANPSQGRLLRPQLKFHRASDLPVYATSAIFEPGSDRNADLDGVMFDDIPWAVSPDEESAALIAQLQAAWPAKADRGLRLYALGYDAYRLIPLLYAGSAPAEGGFPGATGRLVMSPDGVLHRQLPWARFQAGEPVPLPPTPVTGTAGEGLYAE